MGFNGKGQLGHMDHASSLRSRFLLENDIGRLYLCAVRGIGVTEKFRFQSEFIDLVDLALFHLGNLLGLCTAVLFITSEVFGSDDPVESTAGTFALPLPLFLKIVF